MKKYFLLMLATVVCSAFNILNAQKVEQYCEMTAIQKLLSRKVTVDIDYGEERKLFSLKDTRIKDELGKVRAFNSVIDALNFLGRNGWKLVNAFLVTESNQSVYHYVLRREFDQSELADIK